MKDKSVRNYFLIYIAVAGTALSLSYFFSNRFASQGQDVGARFTWIIASLFCVSVALLLALHRMSLAMSEMHSMLEDSLLPESQIADEGEAV